MHVFTHTDGEQYQIIGLEKALTAVLQPLTKRRNKMQKYQCHKIVEALKIDKITKIQGGVNDYSLMEKLEDGGFDTFDTDQAWMDRYKPEVGGRVVRYEDGYVSYSPGKAFEDGYAALKENGVVEYDAKDLLNTRNFIEKVLTRDPDIKFGGSAGISLDGGGADIDILINDRRFNINIKPREPG